ncbi:hypothetical protein ES705_48204 [subsurface metagenome]
MLRYIVLLTVVGSVLLSSFSVAQAAKKPLEPPLELLVPIVDKAPVVDGLLSPGEYDEATRVRGYMTIKGLQLQPGSTLDAPTYILNAKDHIYIAVQWSIADQKVLKAERKKHDSDLWMDDSIEVFLRSPDEMTNKKIWYQFVGNSLGFLLDSKSQGKSWNCNYKYKCTVVNGIWTAELSIPLAELREGPLEPGETWRINVARNKQSPLFNWLHLAASDMYHYPFKEFFLPVVNPGISLLKLSALTVRAKNWANPANG